MRSTGHLFIFEGPKGVGKTTLAQKSVEFLVKNGISCEFLSSPGKIVGTLGNHIYQLHHNNIKEVDVANIDSTSMQTLHIAAHIDSIENLIKPKLNSGTSIILDRTWWSTIVYGQVYGANKRALELLVAAEKIFWEEVNLDATFLITRDKPIDRNFDEKWRQTSQAYEAFFKHETKNSVGHLIPNNSSLNTTLSQILKQINIVSNWGLSLNELLSKGQYE